jgi:hypothetical protein
MLFDAYMEDKQENKRLEIDQSGLRYLNTTRKWTMFISIIGFIALGILVIFGILAGTFLSAFSSGIKGPGMQESLLLAAFFITALLFLFHILYLFRFSKNIAHAVHNHNNKELDKALKNLRNLFIFSGALIIFLILVYFAALILTGSSITLLKGL